MKNFPKPNDYWKPCRPGTIMKVSDSKFKRQRRRLLVQSAMAGVVAGTGILATLFAVLQRSNGTIAKNEPTESGQDKFVETKYMMPIALTCKDIEEQISDYVEAVRTEDSRRTDGQHELIADFAQHLKVCSACRIFVLDAVNDV